MLINRIGQQKESGPAQRTARFKPHIQKTLRLLAARSQDDNAQVLAPIATSV